MLKSYLAKDCCHCSGYPFTYVHPHMLILLETHCFANAATGMGFEKHLHPKVPQVGPPEFWFLTVDRWVCEDIGIFFTYSL